MATSILKRMWNLLLIAAFTYFWQDTLPLCGGRITVLCTLNNQTYFLTLLIDPNPTTPSSVKSCRRNGGDRRANRKRYSGTGRGTGTPWKASQSPCRPLTLILSPGNGARVFERFFASLRMTGRVAR